MHSLLLTADAVGRLNRNIRPKPMEDCDKKISHKVIVSYPAYDLSTTPWRKNIETDEVIPHEMNRRKKYEEHGQIPWRCRDLRLVLSLK